MEEKKLELPGVQINWSRTFRDYEGIQNIMIEIARAINEVDEDRTFTKKQLVDCIGSLYLRNSLIGQRLLMLKNVLNQIDEQVDGKKLKIDIERVCTERTKGFIAEETKKWLEVSSDE